MEATSQRSRRAAWLGLFSSFRLSSKEEAAMSASTTSSTASPDNLPIHLAGELKLEDAVEMRCWTPVQTSGKRPLPRCNHAAAVVGRKMIVIGGESGNGKLKDVQVLHLGKLSWTELGVHDEDSLASPSHQQLPPCRGHSLIAWGKTVLLVGGDLGLWNEKLTVWSFDLDTEHWTKIQAKGEIPLARSNQSVIRAGSILIMFGGQDAKGRKLNDIHVFDLKSLMWLPLHASGKGPSPRSGHTAAMHNDRYMLVFGGASKSKVLSDLYALDVETKEWSQLKPKGFPPTPREGSAGWLADDKWYICGGGDRKGNKLPETVTLDLTKLTWTNTLKSIPQSVIDTQGLSVVMVQKKDRTFLVAFGGYGEHSSTNNVEVLYVSPRTKPSSLQAPPSVKEVSVPLCADVNVIPVSCPKASDAPGMVPLRKLHTLCQKAGDKDVEKAHSDKDEEKAHSEQKRNPCTGLTAETDLTSTSEHFVSRCETELAGALDRRLEEEKTLQAVRTDEEEIEAKLVSARNNHKQAESKLLAALNELDSTRLKLQASEKSQQESNELSSNVRWENANLEREVDRLRNALDAASKELQSVRGALASERTRAFQLQVELFELKEKLQQT